MAGSTARKHPPSADSREHAPPLLLGFAVRMAAIRHRRLRLKVTSAGNPMPRPLALRPLLLVLLAVPVHAEADIRPHLDRWRAWREQASSVVVEAGFEQTGSVFPGERMEPNRFIHRLLTGLYPGGDVVLTEHPAAPQLLPQRGEPCGWLFVASENRLWSAVGPEFRYGWHTAVNFAADGTWASESSRVLGAAYQGLGFHGGFSDCDLPAFLASLPAAAFDAEDVEVDSRPAVRFRANNTRLGDITAVFDAATSVPFELSIERSAGHRFRDRRFPHALPYAGDRVLREIGHTERVVTRWAFGDRGPVPLETTYRERWVFEEGVDTMEVVGEVLTFTPVDRPAARDFHVDFPFFESVDFEATEMPVAIQ